MKAPALLLAAGLAGLAGCASDGVDPTASPVAVTGATERAAYWVDPDAFGIGARARNCAPGVVTIDYTIGSDGRVYDVRIVGSRPTVPQTEFAVRDDLWERHFSAGPENPDRRPVRAREEFVVDCGPGTPKWR